MTRTNTISSTFHNLYRFGFNGQEMDNEITGQTGTHTTAMFWEYDSRLGRRWNLDPKSMDGISEYVCFGNNPLWYNDPNGDTVIIARPLARNLRYIDGGLYFKNGKKYDKEISGRVKGVKECLDKLGEGYEGYGALQELQNSKNKHRIICSYNDTQEISINGRKAENGDGSSSKIYFNVLDRKSAEGYITLGHELFGHSLSADRGTQNNEYWYDNGAQVTTMDDVFAVHMENLIRVEHGLPLRTCYDDSTPEFEAITRKVLPGDISTYDGRSFHDRFWPDYSKCLFYFY